MAKRIIYNSVEEACRDMYLDISNFLITDGMAWLVNKLKQNIVRTVYRRKPSKDYRRTEAFKNSVRGRVIDKGHNASVYRLEIIAFPDPTDMNPSHTSWASGEEDWNGTNVDQNLTKWLDRGHGGMGVHYRPAKFIEKTEEEVDDPKGFSRLLFAMLRKKGHVITKVGEIH